MDGALLVKSLREDCFKDHVATLMNYEDLKVLEWKKPGTSYYYIRYVFDGRRMYVTGDLGEAIFGLTWQADVHSFNDISVGYFHEKLQAYHDDKYQFDSNKAVEKLREWLKDLKYNDVEYCHDEMKELFEGTRGCNKEWEWVETIHNHEEFISELEPNYWEWFYKIGRCYPGRIIGYLVGLQMASEQLNAVVS